jgi:hypothetical protein
MTCRRLVAWAELLLSVVPASVFLVFMAAWLGQQAGVLLLVYSPLFVGGLAGIVALWAALLPRALGHQPSEQMSCRHFVSLATGVLVALFVLGLLTNAPDWSKPDHYGLWIYLIASPVLVAVHVASSYVRVLPLWERPAS